VGKVAAPNGPRVQVHWPRPGGLKDEAIASNNGGWVL
jgi:hypothetical protein